MRRPGRRMGCATMPRRNPLRALALAFVILAAGLVMLPAPAAAEQWAKVDMGKPYRGQANNGLYGVAVGDGDRDGRSEVYFSCDDDGHVYRFQYSNTTWNSSDVGAIVGGNPYEARARALVLGDGDDDGKVELYVNGLYRQNWWNSLINRVFQFVYNGSGWNRTDIGATGSRTNDLALGDGNNDDRNEVYSADQDGHMYVYYKSNDWNTQDMGNPPRFWYQNQWNTPNMRGVAVGDGDNDGRIEVYGATSNSHVYRYNYSSSSTSWNITDVGTGDNDGTSSFYTQGLTRVAVGDGDNDGKNEVYATGYINASVYQFRYNASSSSWTGKNLLSLGANLNALCIALGDGNDDGKNELLVGASNRQVYIISHDSSAGTWSSGSVGSGDGAMLGVDLGTGRDNSTLTEVFAASADGHGYEFYYDRVPPANPVVSSDTHPVPGNWYDKNVVHVTWKDQGYDISGIDGYSVAWDRSSDTVPASTKTYEETVHEATSAALSDGGNYFHIRARDNALNWNKTATHFGPINIDTKAPDSLSLAVNNGDTYTNSAVVTLTVTANDPSPGSGIAKASFSNDGTTWTDWEPHVASRTGWDLTDSRYGGNGSEGTKTVWARVMDGVGHELPANLRAQDGIFLDRVAPSGLSIVINDGATYATSAGVSLKLAASDQAPASGLGKMALSNDGTAWSAWMDWAESASWSLVSGAGGADLDGDRTVYLKVQDRALNTAGPVSDTIFLDRKAPENLTLSINGGAQYTSSATVDLAIGGNDPSPGSGLSEMTLANAEPSLGTWESYASSKGGWSLVSGTGGTDTDGQKAVYLKVRDKAQNNGGPTRDSIFLDRVRPSGASILINNGATYTTTRKVDLALRATDADPSSGIEAMQFSDDGSTWTQWEPYAGSRSYDLPAGDGQKTVHFRCRDRAQNVGDFASASIILDTAAPVISNVRVVSITDISAIITWTTDEESDSGVDWGPTTVYGSTKPDASFVLAHSVTLTGLTASTVYHFQVYSRDRAGNPPAYAGDYQFITAPTPDTTPPQISGVQVGGITDVLAVVSWTTNEPADSTVVYGTDASYGLRQSDGSFLIKHSLTLSGLSPVTLYHFQVQSTDPSGNGPARSADLTFTTLEAPDTSAPVISNVRVSGVTDRLAVVTWETNEPASGAIDFGTDESYGKTISHPGLSSLHELALLNLQPATTYHLRVRSTDASGNGPATSADLNFTTLSAPDTTAPVILNLRAEGVTDTTATVLWETDEIADGFLEYGITVAYGLSSTDNGYTLSHSLLLQALRPDTLYHARVRSSDPSGNAGTSPDITFRTARGGGSQDTTPPVITALEVRGVTNTKAVVIWQTNEVANSEVEYGTAITYGLRASDPSYTMLHSVMLDGLTPSTDYHARVKSTDVFGNGPTVSGDITFRTKDLADTEPPRVTNIQVSGVTATGATITWTTDEPSTSRVEYGTTGAYGQSASSQMHVNNHTVTLSNLSADTTYHFRVFSTDPSGNPSIAGAGLTFTTPRGGGGGGGGTTPGPTTGSEFPWPWVILACLLIVVGMVAAAFFVTRKPPGGGRAEPGSGGPAPAAEDGAVEVLPMDDGAAAAAPAAIDWGAPVPGAPPAPAPAKHIRCPVCKTRIAIYKDVEHEIRCPVCGKRGPYRPKGGTPAPSPTGEAAAPPSAAPLFVHAPEPSPYAALDALVKTPREPEPAARPAPLTVAPSARPARPSAWPEPQPAQQPAARRTRCSNCGGSITITADVFPVRVTCPTCGRSGTYHGPRK